MSHLSDAQAMLDFGLKKEANSEINLAKAILLAHPNTDDWTTEDEVDMLTAFIEFNFPMGYTMEVQWDNYNEFDTHPAFGQPTKTYQVDFYTH